MVVAEPKPVKKHPVKPESLWLLWDLDEACFVTEWDEIGCPYIAYPSEGDAREWCERHKEIYEINAIPFQVV